DEMLARFVREARAAAQLKSPNVVQILDHGCDGRIAYIAMELLEGESLSTRIGRVGRLPAGEVGYIIVELARALAKAHRMGIVHRDLNPANVFLSQSHGEARPDTNAPAIVKVLDFGIAKAIAAPDVVATQQGIVIGTPAYMSPEQVLGRPLDGRSDL